MKPAATLPAGLIYLKTTPADSGFVTNLFAQAQSATGRGPIWTKPATTSTSTCSCFAPARRSQEHVNTEVDVLIVGIAGEGVISVDGQPHRDAARAGA